MSQEPLPQDESTDRLLEDLTADLEPVRRIPPLRWVLAGWIGLAGAAGAGWLSLVGGWRTGLAEVASQNPGFGAIGLGLLLLALGGGLTAVASSVPGRDRLLSVGRGVLWAGVGLGFAVGPIWVLVQAGGWTAEPLAGPLHCVRGALWVALLPVVGVLGFVFWAAPHRPLMSALAGALGAAAVGAAIVHATCPSDSAPHWIAGHAAAPLSIALLLLPALILLARWRAGRARLRPAPSS